MDSIIANLRVVSTRRSASLLIKVNQGGVIWVV